MKALIILAISSNVSALTKTDVVSVLGSSMIKTFFVSIPALILLYFYYKIKNQKALNILKEEAIMSDDKKTRDSLNNKRIDINDPQEKNKGRKH